MLKPEPGLPQAGSSLRTAVLAALGLVTGALSPGVHAFEFKTGNPDLKIRWDNTVRANLAWRVESIDPAIGNNPVADEGDYRFKNGDMITQRLDLLSEFDVSWQDKFGARLSADAWYDHAYSDGKVTQNPLFSALPSGYKNDKYSDVTNHYYNGPYGELLDAFVWANFDAGSLPVAIKAGQFSTYWGMSLFYPGGIAQGQQPIDGRKAVLDPGIEIKESFLPLAQVDVQTQIAPSISLEAQYYFDWATNRFPEGGTYLGPQDLVLQGPDQTGFLQPGFPSLARGAPLEPDKQGNWGVNLKFAPDFLQGHTIGIYYREFDDKSPWLFTYAVPPSPLPKYRAVYAQGVKLWGLSYDGSIGPFAVGAEAGYHMDAGLKSRAFAPVNEGARGDVWHGLVNVIRLVPRNALWDDAQLLAEVTYDKVADVTKNENLFVGVGHPACIKTGTNTPGSGTVNDGCITDDAWSARVRFSPRWLQVLPSLDLSLNLSYSLGLAGNSALAPNIAESAEGVQAGVQLDYKVVHRLTLVYDDFSVDRRMLNGVAVSSPSANYTTADRGRITLTYKYGF